MKVCFAGKTVDDLKTAIDRALSDTKGYSVDGIGYALGGASYNVYQGFRTIARLYDSPFESEMVIAKGNAPEANRPGAIDKEELETSLVSKMSNAMGRASPANTPGTRDMWQLGKDRFANDAHEAGLMLLQYADVDFTDLSKGRDGLRPGPNVVLEHPVGRDIFRGQETVYIPDDFKDLVDLPLLQAFVEKFQDADLVFVDPNPVEFALQAVIACQALRVPVATDYGAKKWPEGKDGELLKRLLRDVNYLAVPYGAVVDGMVENKKASIVLWDSLKKPEYEPEYMLMSDDTNPVFVYDKGKEVQIDAEFIKAEVAKGFDNPSGEGKQTLYKNGVGDTRDGVMMFSRARQDSFETAVRKANVVASMYVLYPGDEYKYHFYDHIQASDYLQELFKDDMPDIKAGRDRIERDGGFKYKTQKQLNNEQLMTDWGELDGSGVAPA